MQNTFVCGLTAFSIFHFQLFRMRSLSPMGHFQHVPYALQIVAVIVV